MTRQSPQSSQSQVALISALVVAVVGASLLAVLVVGLLDGVRGPGPVVLAGLAIGVFLLAFRLLMVARKLRRTPVPTARPPRQAAVRRRPQPRPATRRR